MIKSILIAILVLIVVAFLFLAYFAVCFVGVCQALGARGQAIEWSRNYWNTMSQKRWDELSEEEKDDLVKAYATILDDCGACNQTDYELREYLRKTLPLKIITSDDYFRKIDNLLQKRWEDLSEDEKDFLVTDRRMRLEDFGKCDHTDDEIREYLRKHLPIITINLSNTLSVNDNINE